MGSNFNGAGSFSGGGGAVQWLNDYPVTPGEVLSLRSGVITFEDGKTFTKGGAVNNTSGAPNGQVDGGQRGGEGCSNTSASPSLSKAGGGGAGGYTGKGGNGGRYWNSTTYNGGNGTGGGSGGGASSDLTTSSRNNGGGGGGGSTYLYGQGPNGSGGIKGAGQPYPTGTQRGGAGSPGNGSAAVGGGGTASPHYDSGYNPHGSGGGWCFRFVWPGDESRGHFPSVVKDV
jgi:hypothetical protein